MEMEFTGNLFQLPDFTDREKEVKEMERLAHQQNPGHL